MPIENMVIAGRFVQGSLTHKGDRDTQGRPIPADKQRFFIGVAVPKNDPNVTNIVGQIIGMAWQDSATKQNGPNIQAAIQRVAANLSDPSYSLKIEDGDAKQNPNTAGCYIFRFGSSFDFRCCKFENGANVMISPADIKKGWYVEVAFSAKTNENTDHTAGIYLNPSWIRLIGYGQEIVGGPSADQVFGAPPAAVAGMSAVPVGPAAAMPGAAPTMPAPFGAVPSLPTPAGFNPVGAPPAPVGMPPAPAAGYQAPGTAYGSAPVAPPAFGAPAAAPGVAAPHPGILAGPPSFGG